MKTKTIPLGLLFASISIIAFAQDKPLDRSAGIAITRAVIPSPKPPLTARN